ncbi:thiamine-phosphate pyrophosphorylase [Clostridium pascui]|uniref:thiamine phosphate synthase n=1 Tax=Clostridium pascui TaxID=46609 RepID=UPI00195600BF|nr:thiamine phosphate synthase [Clostridium pascui]MBM7871196.1 thiamine-phosphate pyrophosphorylase [Clostridium pascui]
MNKKNVNYTLYLVTDRSFIKDKSLDKAVEEAILGGATLVQIREKDVDSLDFYKEALKVKGVCKKYDVPLIINDRVDIALAIDADGVHVGQSDLPCSIVRSILGAEKIIGVSTSNVEEALKAQEDGADYVGVGAVFPTTTKDDADSVTIEELSNIKKGLNIPVVAIGGISENNITKLKPANIDGVAVISAILGKENITKAAENLIHKLKIR